MELNDGLNTKSKRNIFKPIFKLMLVLCRVAHGSHMLNWCNQCHAAFKNNIPIDIAFSIILSFCNIEIACTWNSNGVVYALHRGPYLPRARISNTYAMWKMRQDRKCKYVILSQHWVGAVTWNPSSWKTRAHVFHTLDTKSWKKIQCTSNHGMDLVGQEYFTIGPKSVKQRSAIWLSNFVSLSRFYRK